MVGCKKDANHKEIVRYLELLGWTVQDLSMVKNLCDIMAAKLINGCSVTVLCEIKDGSKPPSQRKLTPGELKFKEKWERQGLWRKLETLEDCEGLEKSVT